LKIDKIITFDLLKSVANTVNVFDDEKNRMEKATKKLEKEINSLKRIRDETVIYIDEKIEKKIRILRKIVLPEREGSDWK
jgi:hypothetical protein